MGFTKLSENCYNFAKLVLCIYLFITLIYRDDSSIIVGARLSAESAKGDLLKSL